MNLKAYIRWKMINIDEKNRQMYNELMAIIQSQEVINQSLQLALKELIDVHNRMTYQVETTEYPTIIVNIGGLKHAEILNANEVISSFNLRECLTKTNFMKSAELFVRFIRLVGKYRLSQLKNLENAISQQRESDKVKVTV
jgi:hypothetical protein